MTSVLKYIVTNVLVLLLVKNVSATRNSALDLELYENVLDPVECERQLNYIRGDNTSLRNRLLDASWRVPHNILRGNTRDLGNYFECLDIREDIESVEFGGKYCTISVPINQEWDLDFIENITLPVSADLLMELPWTDIISKKKFYTDDLISELLKFKRTTFTLGRLLGGNSIPFDLTNRSDNVTQSQAFELAICIPKVCTSNRAVNFYTTGILSNLTFNEEFCRLPNDKPWVAADTVAVVILSFIGLITIISTAYDIRHQIFLGRETSRANKFYQSFSIYTNTKKFFVFPSGSSVVTCLDGIRSFAMMWVIIGHTFGTQFSFIPQNPLDAIQFMTAFTSLWITSGTITVDTFFLLSGLLVVYTTAAKMSRTALLKNLHFFYLNRLLRMFPVLAFSVLMSASFLNRLVDGPYYMNIVRLVEDCRFYWWTTLLYVQNYAYPGRICVPHSWYLAIDMQLHILSPIVLFWVLGQKKRIAWLAMGGTLVAVLTGASVYNFLNNFPSAIIPLSRLEDSVEYNMRYYIHTLPRAAPFFVGMIYGYLMHLYRKEKPNMSMITVLLLWVLAFACTTAAVITYYWNIQLDWDNQLMDNIFNTYKRSIWAAGVGWMIFACHNGYGGPINWLLSLQVFKILGRLSYAMYLLHYPLIMLLNASTLAPIYFSVHFSFCRFLVDFFLAVIAAFLVTITIDIPFSNLIKMGMSGLIPRSQSREPLNT